MYGMVSGGGGTSKPTRDRSLSRRSKRSLNYRQSSFHMGERSLPVSFNRSNSSSSVLQRSTGVVDGSRYSRAGGIRNANVETEGIRHSGAESGSGTSFRGSVRSSKSIDEKGKAKSTDAVRMEKGEGNETDEEIANNGQKQSRSKHSRRHRSRRSIYRRFLTLIKQAWTGVTFGSDSEEEEIEQEPRHRPEDINALCRTTHFTRTELQRFYRAFKDRCPTGVITEGAFKDMYCQMFPKGASASQYAHYVFLTLDSQGEGLINFEDLITLLSRLCRGSMADRLCWIFSLYDLNNDGFISRQEMSEVVQAVYDLLGSQTTIPVDGQTVEQKVQFLFETFDTNKDDLISLDEFIDACSKDITLVHNLDAMANYL